MITCHFRMLLKLKRKYIQLRKLVPHPSNCLQSWLSLSASVFRDPAFWGNYLFSDYLVKEQLARYLAGGPHHGVCVREKLEPQPPRVRAAPPPFPPPLGKLPLTQQLEAARLSAACGLLSRVFTPPVTGRWRGAHCSAPALAEGVRHHGSDPWGPW